jgi:hypothetical protein
MKLCVVCSGLDKPECRNAMGMLASPWCFIDSSPYIELCNIQECNPEGGTVYSRLESNGTTTSGSTAQYTSATLPREPSTKVLHQGIVALSVLTGIFIIVFLALLALAVWHWGRRLCGCWRRSTGGQRSLQHKSIQSCSPHARCTTALASTTPSASQQCTNASLDAQAMAELPQIDVCCYDDFLGHPTRQAGDLCSSMGCMKSWANMPSGLSLPLWSSNDSLPCLEPANPVSQERRQFFVSGAPGWDTPLAPCHAQDVAALSEISQQPLSQVRASGLEAETPLHPLREAAGDMRWINSDLAALARVTQPPLRPSLSRSRVQSHKGDVWSCPAAAQFAVPGAARMGVANLEAQSAPNNGFCYPPQGTSLPASLPLADRTPRGSLPQGSGIQMLRWHFQKQWLAGRDALSLEGTRRTCRWQHSPATRLSGEKARPDNPGTGHMLTTHTTGSSSIPRGELPVMECSLSMVDSAPSDVDRRNWSGSGGQQAGPMGGGGSLPLLPVRGRHTSPPRQGFEIEHVSAGWESPVGNGSGPVWTSASLPCHPSPLSHSGSAVPSPSMFSHGIPAYSPSPRSGMLADSPAYGVLLPRHLCMP